MVKKYFKKLWREPNPWVSGLALLLISSASITSVINGLEWVLKILLETQLLFLLGILIIAISVLVVIRKILSLKTVPFDNQPALSRFSPSLQLLNWWRSRSFKKVHIDNELVFFNFEDKQLFSLEYPTFLPESGLAESRPTIILRLPARSFMPIADFINLHLLRRLSIAGASVMVIVTDVLYSDKQIPNSAINLTMIICKKVLGNHANVKRLSMILADNSLDFTHFVLNNYVPFLAEHDQKLPAFKEPRDKDKSKILRANNFLSFGLFVFAIQKLLKIRKAVFVMQWRERILKWEDYLPLIKGVSEPNLKGLILSETVMDYNNNPILTGSHVHHKCSLFTLTDDPDFVAKVIFKYKLMDEVIQWEIPQFYINWLSKVVFGIAVSKKKSLKPTFCKKRFVLSIAKKFIYDQAIRDKIVNTKWEEIYIRMRFYRKYTTSRSLFGKLYL